MPVIIILVVEASIKEDVSIKESIQQLVISISSYSPWMSGKDDASDILEFLILISDALLRLSIKKLS